MTTTTYAADRTALLIIVPYNDFMSEGGSSTRLSRKQPKRSASTTTCASWFLRSERRVYKSSSCPSPLARRRLRWVEAREPNPSCVESGPGVRRRNLGRRVPSGIRPPRWRRRRARALGAKRLRQYRSRRPTHAAGDREDLLVGRIDSLAGICGRGESHPQGGSHPATARTRPATCLSVTSPGIAETASRRATSPSRSRSRATTAICALRSTNASTIPRPRPRLRQ